MVGVPIGNLEDITLRALRILSEVSAIVCEDTRQTIKILNHHRIKNRLVALHGYSSHERADSIIAGADGDIAYVSDAGTPNISDPGAVLVSAARMAGWDVIPVPGPSALGGVLSISSVSPRSVTFEGFLSPKQGRRKRRLQELADSGNSVVLYESPHRVVKMLRDLAEISPDCMVLVAREMTKKFEEYLELPVREAYEVYETRASIKGEFTILVTFPKNS